MAETKRFPLASILATRDATLAKDGLLTNCYKEVTPLGEMVVKRPGYTLSQSLTAGCAQGAFTLNGTPYFIVADSFGSSQTGIGGAVWTAKTAATKPTGGNGPGTTQGGSFASLGGNLYAMGGRNNGDTTVSVYKSTDNGQSWSTISTPWTGTPSLPGLQCATTYNNKLWVLGIASARRVDSSSDGITWSTTTSDLAGGGSLNPQALIVHNNLLYAFIGTTSSSSQIWSSPDGVTWTSVNGAISGIGSITGYGVVSLNGNLYLIGGINGSSVLNSSVWKSGDNGVTWVQLTSSAAFGTLYRMACFAFNNYLWVAGGYTTSGNAPTASVYRSTDGGVTWSLITSSPGWTARGALAYCLHNSTMYVGSGLNASGVAVSSTHFAATTSTNAFSPAPPTTCQPYQTYLIPATPTTTAQVFIKNTTNAYVWDGSTLTAVTDPDYPTTTVPGVAALDGTVYVMNTIGQIFGSDLNAPTSWSALNFISANSEADAAVALARQLNYVIAFKQYSTEVFYDAGNATGSPLGKVQNALLEVGCASATSLAFADNTIYFMSQTRQKGRAIMKMEGYTPKTLSTPAIERLLNADSLSTVYAFVVKIAGHFFYVLTLVNTGVTLVFDEATQEWAQWTTLTAASPASVSSVTAQTDGTILVTMPLPHGLSDGDPATIAGATPSAANGTYNVSVVNTLSFTYVPSSTVSGSITGSVTATFYTESYCPAAYYTTANGVDYLLDKSTGAVYSFSPTTYQDNGNPIDVLIRTKILDFGTSQWKRYEQVELVGDNTETVYLVQYSDDDYQTWSTYEQVMMDYDRPLLTCQGSSRRRAYRVRCTANAALRISDLEFTVNLGAF